ncbi:alanine--glyoxylate aminotransferase family protein [Pelagibius litoralis]|uniref:Alanine--glyoxylate aminotransferase family protein n=1 Tax=Pelagibius litoralis TaxID=374515 RepID=A0A967EYF4_9PROT|nr:alanine--glyoxylate aminotransferase family protein [Pelagibius litoralis]NIA69742.1 alanine--glyoxylate aminotransferase family protein [Pelagibius litoralis]
MQNLFPKQPVITLSAGPVAAYPRVLQAMSGPVHYDYDTYFQTFYEAVSRKLARALKTDQIPLILHYEPAVGLEAASASLIGADDVVLNLASGVYGKGFGYWAARTAKAVHEVEVPYNDSITADQVAEALRNRPETTVVSMVHHDTPSGTINSAREIGKVVRDHGALLLIDAVSSFGGMDIHPGDCFADIFVTGPSKCLGGSPGLTTIAVSERAWQHIEANPATPRASVLSLLDWKNAWRKEEGFPYTPSVSEVNGLDAVLDQYLDEGPEKVWQRHALTSSACRAGIKAMGLSLWAAREEIASPTTTAVAVPEGMSDEEILAVTRKRFGVVFSRGRGDTLEKLIRIGHMGPVAEPSYAIIAVTALGGALREMGHKADVAAGVEACMAVIAAQAD